MDFGRRDFLALGAGAMLAAELPLTAEAKRDPLAPLKVENFEIKPFGAIQVSDTHIVRVDRRDDERKMKLAAGRSFAPFAEHYLDEAIHLAKANGDMLLHTGDLIDFVSAANLDLVEAHFAGNDSSTPATTSSASTWARQGRTRPTSATATTACSPPIRTISRSARAW